MNVYQIRKIVVPIDLSETSLNALDTAVSIAKKRGASLCLINVSENNFEPPADDVLFTSPLSHSTDVLTALAGAIHHHSGLMPEVIQLEGNAADTIVRHSLMERTDLIVIGSHGASGYRDGFIGSTAYSVMKNAACLVLSVPPKRKYTAFRKLLFPIRPVTGALARYDVVSQLVSEYAVIDVLGLSYRKMEKETNVLEKIIDEIKGRLIRDGAHVAVSWNNGTTIPDDVLQFTLENGTDLIVVTSVLDITTKAGFIGPHSQKIINCSRVPVLHIKKISVPSWV